MHDKNLSKVRKDEPKKQGQLIRLEEARLTVNNQDQKNHGVKTTIHIDAADGFREYYENEEFRKMLDSGAVCYIEEMFILNMPRYVTHKCGKYRLTAYARSHLHECALVFTLRKEYVENE